MSIVDDPHYRKCFVLGASKFDVSSAEKFGAVTHLDDRSMPPVFHKTLAAAWRKRLEDEGYEPQQDFLILTGNLIVLTMVVAELVAVYGDTPVLAYCASTREYVPLVAGQDIEESHAA